MNIGSIRSKALSAEKLMRGYELMCQARQLSDIYETNAKVTSKYVHATSRGHEACQLALGLQLKPIDFVSAYYRDDSLLLAMGITPYSLMMQLMAKKDDPFTGGRSYYSHPALNDPDKPKIPHQSSATGMQAIPTTGVAMGLWYKEQVGLHDKSVSDNNPIVVCSLGVILSTDPAPMRTV